MMMGFYYCLQNCLQRHISIALLLCFSYHRSRRYEIKLMFPGTVCAVTQQLPLVVKTEEGADTSCTHGVEANAAVLGTFRRSYDR